MWPAKWRSAMPSPYVVGQPGQIDWSALTQQLPQQMGGPGQQGLVQPTPPSLDNPASNPMAPPNPAAPAALPGPAPGALSTAPGVNPQDRMMLDYLTTMGN